MRARRAAGGANGARPEPGARTVGGEIVHRRPDDRDVDPVELRGVLGRRQPGERQQPGVVGLVGEAELTPPLRADRTRPRSYASLYPGRVISRARCSVCRPRRGPLLRPALAAVRPAAGRDPVLAPVRDPRGDRDRVRHPRDARAPSRRRTGPRLATPSWCRRRRPRLGRDGRRGGRAGARRCRAEASSPVQRCPSSSSS